MRLFLTLPLLLGLLDCGRDETLSGYGAADREWHLAEISGQPFDAEAILQFPEEGKITGSAPCNKFYGKQVQPYPWFQAEAIASTRRACPDLDAETAFFSAIAAMTLAEVVGDTLILSNTEGDEMMFEAR
ncbi:MAG: META domain-containing protein [Pseudomonadota bacterium]